MAFKDVMIAEAEKAINSARERRYQLETELETTKQAEHEARTVLQLLRTGKVDDPNDGKRMVRHEDYMVAINTIQQEMEDFSYHDVTELTGGSSGGAKQKLKQLHKGGTLELVKEGKRGSNNPQESTRYRLASMGRN